MRRVQDEQKAGLCVLRLVKMSETDFAVISSDERFNVRGALKVAVKALLDLGVPCDEVETAYADMETEDNNVAEFGLLNKGFMFSHLVEQYIEVRGHS